MTTKPYPSQTQDRYIVRFPDGMRDQIAEAAKANNRSMNAEIVARLEASFDDSRLTMEQVEGVVAALAKHLSWPPKLLEGVPDPLLTSKPKKSKPTKP